MSPHFPSPRRLVALAAAFVAAGAIGCSSPEKSEIEVARVGDRTIMLDYFERTMNRMDPKFIPSDINTQQGREEVLDVMINKEVMAMKAEELGMDADGSADEQAEMVTRLKAVQKMSEDVEAPAQDPTEEDILDYYEKFPRKLDVSYMLFDWEEEAWEAKRLVEGGENWNDVARRLEAGAPNQQTDDYSLAMTYGTIADDLEYEVFQLPTGQVSDPIDSIYGWFLIRVDEVSMQRVPPLEEIRDRVRESVIKQESALLKVEFIDQVFEKYALTINDEAMKIVWDALPPDASLQPPTPQEELEPLVIDSRYYDEVLISYADRTIDLREYVDIFNESSVFGRPRKERGVGTFRRMLKEDAIRYLMPIEAEARGYLEDPAIQDAYKNRREQAMVTRLHRELVSDEVKVSAEEIEAYWAEHSDDWIKPERREIVALVAATETDAISARIDVQGGMSWEEAVEKYCIESDIKTNGGEFGVVTPNAETPFRDIAFGLQSEGDISSPTQIGDGQWALARLETLLPREEPLLDEVRSDVGRRVRGIKEEELFQEKVAEWRTDYGVETSPEHLMKATYAPVEEEDPQGIPVNFGR
ncbi:MAG TPA: peptidyl-prolyl cis-trans isomerase [Candidatus Krumholzibacteria bacterium]|nr:peptidyl-prolyl cis-trans isomerase [Candidatus Krumholzibacteria bacterium]